MFSHVCRSVDAEGLYEAATRHDLTGEGYAWIVSHQALTPRNTPIGRYLFYTKSTSVSTYTWHYNLCCATKPLLFIFLFDNIWHRVSVTSVNLKQITLCLLDKGLVARRSLYTCMCKVQTNLCGRFTPVYRTCWIYNLCGSIRIYKNQISGIDPYADQ